MSTLTDQLSALSADVKGKAPAPVMAAIEGAINQLAATFSSSSAIHEGQHLPPFKLQDASGTETSSNDLLQKSALLITFYRGGWCPYCNLALHDLQEHLDDFTRKAVHLVAISPELPDESMSTIEKHDLKFTVLSDVGNKYAKELGIVWKQPDSLRSIYQAFGTDLKARNGDDSFELPIPTTLLVDKQGIVQHVFIEADYRKRLDTQTALKWTEDLA